MANRATKRANSKKNKRISKLSEEDRVSLTIDKELTKQAKALKKTVLDKAAPAYTDLYENLLAYALMETYGFKSKRINRVINHIRDTGDSMNKGFLVLDDVKNELKQDKIKIEG